MKNVKHILVISRMDLNSQKAVHFGISLARAYDAHLLVLHLVANPVAIMPENTPGLFPEIQYITYANNQKQAKVMLDEVIRQEMQNGFPIKELVSDTESLEEVLNIVRKEHIDLIIMLAHEEGRIEHALFGGENDAIIRKMPCSILLVKSEPEPAKRTVAFR